MIFTTRNGVLVSPEGTREVSREEALVIAVLQASQGLHRIAEAIDGLRRAVEDQAEDSN